MQYCQVKLISFIAQETNGNSLSNVLLQTEKLIVWNEMFYEKLPLPLTTL